MDENLLRRSSDPKYDEDLVNLRYLKNFVPDIDNKSDIVCSFIQMHPNFGSKTIASNTFTIITEWDTSDIIKVGDFEYDNVQKAIKIPAGTARAIEIGGTLAGKGYASAEMQLWSSSGLILSGQQYGILVQSYGNGYWKNSLPNTIMIIPDTTKDYYVKLNVAGYNATFEMNNGYGTKGTTIRVLKVM